MTKPILLHLELRDDHLQTEDIVYLKRYGEMRRDNAFTRDIIVPSDITLHALHYAIQRLFGWQNSHLRSFQLPKKDFDRVTKGQVKEWADLVGIYFQSITQAGEGDYWDDEYNGNAWATWLKNRYTGPYEYHGTMENKDFARRDIEQFIEQLPVLEIRPSFDEWLKLKDEPEKEPQWKPLLEATTHELKNSIILEGGIENLLERLVVADILAEEEQDVTQADTDFLTTELMYHYDYGDGWTVYITRPKDTLYLTDNLLVLPNEIKEATASVEKNYRPVLIHREGLNVLDDVGGLSGFAEMLKQIYEEHDISEAQELRAWSKFMGWAATKKGIHKSL